MCAVRHDRFYLELVTFQIDNTLYKVPKQQFVTGSSFFSDLFQVPQGKGVVEGKDDEHPIHLPEGVTKDEFEILIKVVCSSAFGEHLTQLTKDEWICCLKLATMWDFKALRQTAIDRLSNIPPAGPPKLGSPATSTAEQVALGMKYGVPTWIQDGVVKLVTQDSELVLTEGEKDLLGFEAALNIHEVREEVRSLRDRSLTERFNATVTKLQCSRCSRPFRCGYCNSDQTRNVELPTPDIGAETSLAQVSAVKKFSIANGWRVLRPDEVWYHSSIWFSSTC